MMRRRDFLRATLVTAGSVVVSTACTDEEGGPGACDVQEDDASFPQSVASGDPKPDSVVLWTRLVDSDQKTDLSLSLVVALDEGFTQLVTLKATSGNAATVGSNSTRFPVTARAEFDHCVKVKVSGLSAGTTYYYRFYYTTGNGCVSSRIGRTRTAPAPDADVPVRFAFVSSQDYVGRYYNAYAALARQQLDFIVHLGDYIVETTGDPSFQAPSEERKITFSDVNGAIAFEPAQGAPYCAAKSLSNYRELYRTYRSDRALQRVHELFPMIAVWGDHEFSGDCHGATATYFNGRQPETDEERRKAANQAWFEYMPVDYTAGDDFRYNKTVEYPEDITIYRDFTFGKHVHLVMTDLRTYRADHLIPEDGFPGKIFVKNGAFGNPDDVPELAGNYIENIDMFEDGYYANVLKEAAPVLGFDPSLGYTQDEGPRTISVAFVNAIVEKLNEQGAEPPLDLIDPSVSAFWDRGLAYVDLGKYVDLALEKPDFYSAFGSRYFVVKDTFDAASLIAFKPTPTGRPAEAMVMGEAQLAWFKDKINGSKSTWKVWGNEYCLSQLAIDITMSATEPLNRRFYLSCDGWDGFREQRNALLREIAAPNVVAISGDPHAFLAGTPAVDSADPDPSKIVEFVGAAISSTTYQSRLQKQVASHPLLKNVNVMENIAELIEVDPFNPKAATINPYLAFSNTKSNGFCIAEANAEEFVVSMHMLPADALAKPLYEEADAATLDDQITITRFRTAAGESELYLDEQGTWKKWTPNTATQDG